MTDYGIILLQKVLNIYQNYSPVNYSKISLIINYYKTSTFNHNWLRIPQCIIILTNNNTFNIIIHYNTFTV